MYVTVERHGCHHHELPADEMIKSATLIAIRSDFLENKIVVKMLSLFAFPSMFITEF